MSYWLTAAGEKRYPRLENNLRVDVVVIGGGITGITAAYLLKRAGRTVALVEREQCLRRDTGHTTAHITYVTDLLPSELVKYFGRDDGQAAWDAGLAAMQQIEENIRQEQADCEFRHVPGYLFGSLKKDPADDAKSLQQEAEAAAEMDFEGLYMDKVPVFNRPGIRFANQAKFHPVKYLKALLAMIPGDGCHVFEQTEVQEVGEEPLNVKANGQSIECGYVVVATHTPLMGKASLVSATLLQSKLVPHSTYAVGARLPQGLYPEALFWDTSDPYYYLRIDRHEDHDYAIFGGVDHKTGQQMDTKTNFQNLVRMLLTHLPQAVVDHHWSGQVFGSNDGLPYIGEVAKGQFAATGYAGNGMTFGTLGAMMACDAAMGRKNPWSDLFSVSRKKIRGGTWDYLRENIDYPYYMIKDRLTRSEGKSVDALAPGEGKILRIDGRRVAAYMDEKGGVTMVSPVCPHMGCIVHWNGAESTWDCPCHGSRFRATGQVLGGPAETSLERVDVTQAKS